MRIIENIINYLYLSNNLKKTKNAHRALFVYVTKYTYGQTVPLTAAEMVLAAPVLSTHQC